MTVQTTNVPYGALHGLAGWLSRIFWKVAENSRGAQAARRAEYLFSLSDEELAARGLRRDLIVYEAFGARAGL